MHATTAHDWSAWDLQTWVTLGLGLLALAYLVRRWWPRRSRPATSCGTGQGSSTAASGCSSCEGCGTGQGTPMRDHRSERRGLPPASASSVRTVHTVQWPPPRPH